MSTESPIIRRADADDADSIARLVHRNHTISFAPFASEDWVASRNIDEYRARWQRVFDSAEENDATYVPALDNSIVGTYVWRLWNPLTIRHGLSLSACMSNRG
jgi:hypothetical protein